MSDRLGRTIELASVVVIGACVLLFGWALLRTIAEFRVPSTVILAVAGVLQLVAVVRNRSAGGPMANLRATRDVAFVAAIVFALLVVNGAARWAIGACVAAVEFALVLELLARLTPAPPAP